MEPRTARHLEREASDWFDWLFRDKQGRTVIAQFPNAALWFALAFAATRLVFSPTGAVDTVLGFGFSAALLWWAVDETIRGVNPFRRLLGVWGVFFVIVTVVTGLA